MRSVDAIPLEQPRPPPRTQIPESGICASRPLAQMIHEAQEFSEPKLKPQTREALLEWFNQSERLWIARTHYHLRGPLFIDFAERIGVDQPSAYQLVKLILRDRWRGAVCRLQSRRRRTG